MRKSGLTGVLTVALALSTAPLWAQEISRAQVSRELREAVQSTYIVRFAQGVNPSSIRGRANDIARRFNGNVRHIYNVGSFKGFAIQVNGVAFRQFFSVPPADIESVTPDGIVTINRPPPGKGPGSGDTTGCSSQIIGWNINRLLSTGDTGESCGQLDEGNFATGPVICVLDTGIDLNHPDINVDAAASVNFSRDKSKDDQNGHGTHVAGIIAARNNDFGSVGVAPGMPVVSIKVLDRRGSGSYTDVMEGVQYAASIKCEVVNMSLGGTGYEPLDSMIQAVSAQGVYFSLAAGNSSADIANYSPARASVSDDSDANSTPEGIFTIVSFDEGDVFSSFSNYDLDGNLGVAEFALPGGKIYATYKNGEYRTLSGTSMAAPHMAGLIARRLAAEGTISPYKDTNGSIPHSSRSGGGYPVPGL